MATSNMSPRNSDRSPRYPDPRALPTGPVQGETRSSLMGIPLKHLTKMERKRIEWERQKAEDEELQRQVKMIENMRTQTNSVKPQRLDAMNLPHVQARMQQQEVPMPSEPVKHSNVEVAASNDISTATVVVKNSQAPPTFINSQPSLVPGLTMPDTQPRSTSQPEKPSEHLRASPGVVKQPTVEVSVAQSQPAPLAPVPPPMSKVELKKLQWQRERAVLDKQPDYDPWGRPGAGAPLLDAQGHVVADYNSRKRLSEEAARSSLQDEPAAPAAVAAPSSDHPATVAPVAIQQYPSTTTAMPAHHHLPPQAPHAVASTTTSQHFGAGPSETQLTSATDGDATNAPPAAIRSSFSIGAAAPNENKYTSLKQLQQKQWLADLEKQREEQRQRKLAEQRKDLEYFAEPPKPEINYSQPNQVKTSQNFMENSQSHSQRQFQQPTHHHQQHPQHHQQQQPGSLWTNEHQPEQPDTFIRGQNAPMDARTRAEKEQVRRKEQEHQDFIRRQMEERQSEKRRDREQRWQEEMAEEARLQKERDNLQKQYEFEQLKQQNKKEAEEKQLQRLTQAMEAEKERAEWEKHEKRMRKLRKGGHDTSHYQATFEAKRTPREAGASTAGGASAIVNAPTNIPGLSLDASHTSHARPYSEVTSYMSPLPLDAQEARAMRTHEPYTENRVLTPSVYRSSQNYELDPKMREFGVQADLAPGLSRESSVEIEFRSGKARAQNAPQRKKKVRVLSAAEVKQRKSALKQQSTYTIETPSGSHSAPLNRAELPEAYPEQEELVPIERRPAWGYQNLKRKKKLTQSERDPYFSAQKDRRDALRARRQETLERIANANAPKVSQKTTAATRQRSRSLSSKKPPRPDGFTSPSSTHIKSQNRTTGAETRPQRMSSRSPAPPSMQHVITMREVRDEVHRARSRSPPRSQRVTAAASQRALVRSPSSPAAVMRRHDDAPGDMAVDYMTDLDLTAHSKYADAHLVSQQVADGQFVPFVRSANILDPSRADSPLVVSREPTDMQRARRAYVQEHEPAKYGTVLENYDDARVLENVPLQKPPTYTEKRTKDPIFNPAVVTDHPSGRQNRILQQLSDLRRGLMQKQREMSVLPATEEVN